MTKEQFAKAKKIENDLMGIEIMLERWEKERGSFLHSHIPSHRFDSHKVICISELNKKKAALEKEFAEI